MADEDNARPRPVPAMVDASELYRVSLSPFRPNVRGIETVLGGLVPRGFLQQQFCVVGSPAALAPVTSALDPRSVAYPHLSALLGNLEGIHAPEVSVPIVASAGPISDALLKKQLWLSSTLAAPMRRHLCNGDLVLAVNARDHDQFVHATRPLLGQSDGTVITHMFGSP